MRILLAIISILALSSSSGQSEAHKEKFRLLEPDVWMNIWDKEHSRASIDVDSLTYDEIPKTLEFRGTVVTALKWIDAEGEKILVQSVTGHFTWKDFNSDSTDFMVEDKSELYAYLFEKKTGESTFKRKWRVYDFNECYGVDWNTAFIPKATTITDLDDNGITEVTIPYVLICRGGMDSGEMKMIMYEGQEKFALRGSTQLMCGSEHPYGGQYTASSNLRDNLLFGEFLNSHWDRHKCENGRFY